MALPEVRRGNFLYRDTLFVDLGDHKRHPRASPSELKDLLLPKGAPPKDQVAHWYEAQLVHYGLPRTKDKNSAKVRLTSAIAGKTLKVPDYVVQMEGDMKKEYARGLKRAVSVTKSGAETTPVKGKKQQDKEDGVIAGTRISIKKGDFSFEYSSTAGKAGAKAQKAKPKLKRLQDAKEPKKATPKPKITAKAAAISSASRFSDPASSPVRSAPSSAPPRPKQTARRSRPFTHPSPSSRPSQSTPQRSYDHTPASFSNYDDDDMDLDDAPPSYHSLTFAHPPSPPHRGGDGVVQISGTYALHVTTASSRPLAPRTLSLAIDHATCTLWGHFRIGPKSGLVQVDDISGIPSGQQARFGWRSEDENTYQAKTRFGKGCEGLIQFHGEGGVKGVFGGGMMYGEDVEFWGTLENELEKPEVEEVVGEWEGFVARAYGRG